MAKLTKYEEERALTEMLAKALVISPCAFADPHAGGKPETGIDVLMTAGDRVYGVQVTVPGDRRAEAVIAREANATNNGVYSMWVNANSHAAYKQFASSIERKAAIAERHNFSGYDETWLLLVAGVPTTPGAASTLLPPWFDAHELTQWTAKSLTRSKYDCVFIHSILDVKPRLLAWTRRDEKWNER